MPRRQKKVWLATIFHSFSGWFRDASARPPQPLLRWSCPSVRPQVSARLPWISAKFTFGTLILLFPATLICHKTFCEWNVSRLQPARQLACLPIYITSPAPTKRIFVKFEMETVTNICREIPTLVTIGQKLRVLYLNTLRTFYCCRRRHKSAFSEWNGTRLSGYPRRYKQ
jgi:hypothetical protein